MKWKEFALLRVGLIPFHHVTFNLIDGAIIVLKIVNYLIVPACDDIHPITQGIRHQRYKGASALACFAALFCFRLYLNLYDPSKRYFLFSCTYIEVLSGSVEEN